MSVLRSPLVAVVVRRLLLAVPLLVVSSALSFVLVSLAPGDPVLGILGPEATPEASAQLRAELGLDRPLYEQYARWVGAALSGDLGTSIYTSDSVAGGIAERAPVTLSLAAGALLLSVVLGISLGLASAVTRGPLARLIDIVALVGWALPAFWVGAMLILLFAVTLGWLPATGYAPLSESPSGWARSLVLPVAALSLGGVAAVTKQTRESLLEILSSEYIRMAWANGVRPWSIYLRHALKNASIRVATILGILAVSLIGGAVLVESVFALPGLGSLAVRSSLQHDLPMVQGIVVLVTVLVVIVNLLIDLAYLVLNPRVRLG